MPRPTLDALPRIDVRAAARAVEPFSLDYPGALVSPPDGPEGDRITVRLAGAELHVELVSTPCRFGGSRRWGLCPDCGRRCAILYLRANLLRALACALSGEAGAGVYLECRACVGRPYASQGWGARRTLDERARRAARKAWPGRRWLCEKPRGRWHRTQARLEAAAHGADLAAMRRFLRMPG